jgi:hypothetical protein
MQWQGTTGYLITFENNATNHAVHPTILGAQTVVTDTALNFVLHYGVIDGIPLPHDVASHATRTEYSSHTAAKTSKLTQLYFCQYQLQHTYEELHYKYLSP